MQRAMQRPRNARPSPTAMEAPRTTQLTRRQLALLHVARERLGLDEDAYRDLLELEAGVRSARELDAEGFRAVLRRLERLGFHPRPREDALPARPGMATPAQLSYLTGLWHRYTGRSDDPNPEGLFIHPTALCGMLMGVSRTNLAWRWSGRPELARAGAQN